MNNSLLFILIFSLFCAAVYASDSNGREDLPANKSTLPPDQLSVAQKLLLYDRVSIEPYCWADYDVRTIATLSRVNKELRDTINFARNELIKKHAKKITLSKPMFNRYSEWCSFGTTKTKAMGGSYTFFGNSFSNEFCSACFIDATDAVSMIIPITTDTWSGFHIRRIDNAHRDIIVIPQKKQWWYISYKAEDTHLLTPLNQWNTTIGQCRKTYPLFIDPIITAFKDGAEDIDEKALSLTRTCGMTPEKVVLTINLDDPIFKERIAHLCEQFKNNLNNETCACTTNHIDNVCREKYEHLHALLEYEGLNASLKLLHHEFLQYHVLHSIMENREENAILYANPHGELIIEVNSAKKHFYSRSDAIYRLSLEDESTNNQHDSALDAKYAARAEHFAQHISIVGDNLCHYTSHDAIHDIRILHLVLNKDYRKSMPFKLSLPEEYTITDCVVKAMPETSHLLCIGLLAEEDSKSPSALFCCDVGEWYDTNVKEYRHPTVEQAQKHFYDYMNQTDHWPRFMRQLIKAPPAVLTTIMQWIRMNHENKLIGSEKNPIQRLDFPNYTDDKGAHNKDLPVFFRPHNPLDRLWYALNIPVLQFTRLQKRGDMDLEEIHILGGLGIGAVGFIGGSATQKMGFLSAFLLGINGFFHSLTLDHYNNSTDTPWIKQLLPYTIFGLVSYFSCNGFIPRLAYTTLPFWFHAFDRFYMALKPIPVELPLGILYNSFPSRMRRSNHTMITKGEAHSVKSLAE